MECGGLSETVFVTHYHTQLLCDMVRGSAEVKTDKNYGFFRAISYRTQVVAGCNYFIKVHVGGSDYIHLRAFNPLPCDGGGVTLTSVQEGKTLNDPIEYF